MTVDMQWLHAKLASTDPSPEGFQKLLDAINEAIGTEAMRERLEELEEEVLDLRAEVSRLAEELANAPRPDAVSGGEG